MLTTCQVTRIVSLTTCATILVVCMLIKSLSRTISSQFHHKGAFRKSCHDFYAWASQVIICCVTAAYSAGSTDDTEDLPLARVILQACRVCTKINLFYYPNVALAFVTIYWNLEESYTSYYIATNLIFLSLFFVKAYVFVQDFSIPTWPDKLMRHILAVIEIILGVMHGNWWIFFGGILVVWSIGISPPYSFTRSLPFSTFKHYLLGMALASVCQTIGFYHMLQQICSEQVSC